MFLLCSKCSDFLTATVSTVNRMATTMALHFCIEMPPISRDRKEKFAFPMLSGVERLHLCEQDSLSQEITD